MQNVGLLGLVSHIIGKWNGIKIEWMIDQCSDSMDTMN